MALGSNRDYTKTHKLTIQAIKDAGWLQLWECPSCSRKNHMGFDECPRCKTER
jgi:hypothetical protein